jgi:hypothetical protein
MTVTFLGSSFEVLSVTFVEDNLINVIYRRSPNDLVLGTGRV